MASVVYEAGQRATTPGFAFYEDTHEYRLDGVRLPSVTQLLQPIKPDFSMVPPSVLEAKRALGTAVHLACELDDLGELDDDSTDEQVMGYVAAWRRFRLGTAAIVLANERRLYHPALRFAGTVDRVCDLSLPWRGTDARSLWIIDLKTGDEPHASYGVQLAGYELLLDASKGALGTREHDAIRAGLHRASLHLRGDGTYRFHQFQDPSDAACFMACLAFYQWKENHAS